MQINWFNEKPKDCVVTVANGNLTLNKPATNFFDTAYSVMLGYNKDNKLMFIKPLSKEVATKHDIPENAKYRITVRSSYSRVANKAFVNEIADLMQLDLENQTYKYKATWDAKEKLLIVDLKEAV